MATSADRSTYLVDTSVALALVVADHEHHEATFVAIGDRRLGLAGHAAFETYSVLTRLPTPGRLTPAAAHRLMSANFPDSRFLSAERAAALLVELSGRGIAGGSVYDALVGAAAAEHGLPLVSRDQRARDSYRELGVDLEMLPL